jgi:hypothetical protein
MPKASLPISSILQKFVFDDEQKKERNRELPKKPKHHNRSTKSDYQKSELFNANDESSMNSLVADKIAELTNVCRS